MKRLLIGIALITLLLAAASTAAVAMQRIETLEYTEDRAIVYLPPPEIAEVMSLGHRTLAADILWVQALQYSVSNWQHDYRDLPRFVELAVDLDPDFEYAYWWGGTTSPHNTGGWRWVNLEASNRILEKGLERFPDNWRMWLQLGFNRGIAGDDRKGATEAFARAARIPGSPPHLGPLAARYAASTGAFDAARMYARTVIASSDDENLTELMERRLLEIDIEEALVGLDAALQEFIRRHGKAPGEVEELVNEGLVTHIPPEPLGGEYYIHEGEVRSSSLTGGRLRPFGRPLGCPERQ